MIRNLFTGIWVCAMTLLGVQIAIMMAPELAAGNLKSKNSSAAGFADTELLASSQIENGAIKGYLLARFTYVLTEKGLRFPVALGSLMTDGFNEFAADADFAAGRGESLIDLDAVSMRLRDIVNRRAGENIIHTIYLTQLDYFRPKEIRARSAARQAVIRGNTSSGSAGNNN